MGAGGPHTRGALLGASARGTPLPLSCSCSSAPPGGAGSVHLWERIPSSGRAPSFPFLRVLRWPRKSSLPRGRPRRKRPLRVPGRAPLRATYTPQVFPSISGKSRLSGHRRSSPALPPGSLGPHRGMLSPVLSPRTTSICTQIPTSHRLPSNRDAPSLKVKKQEVCSEKVFLLCIYLLCTSPFAHFEA